MQKGQMPENPNLTDNWDDSEGYYRKLHNSYNFIFPYDWCTASVSSPSLASTLSSMSTFLLASRA